MDIIIGKKCLMYWIIDYKRKDYYEEVLVLIMERYDVIRIFGKGIGGWVFLVVEKESGK